MPSRKQTISSSPSPPPVGVVTYWDREFHVKPTGGVAPPVGKWCLNRVFSRFAWELDSGGRFSKSKHLVNVCGRISRKEG